MADLHLGQRVRITGTLRRVVGGDGPARGSTRKSWQRSPLNGAGEGVVVGLRTLQNGYVRWGSYDDPSTWHVQETVPAVLVAVDVRSNPIYVHPDDVHPIDRPSPGGSVTIPSGTTVRLEHDGEHTLVMLDAPDAPEDLRTSEAGRVVGGGFQTPLFAAYTLSPHALRAIADLIEEHDQ